METITYQPIGIVHSPYKTPEGTPIQPTADGGSKATIEFFPEYAEGLKDLEGFSHIHILFHAHRAKSDTALLVTPFLDYEPRGVFATRAPSRPNPIGLSVVRLESIEGNTLHVSSIDILDGSPVLDVKPYIPQFDQHQAKSIGWMSGRVQGLPDTMDDGRFT